MLRPEIKFCCAFPDDSIEADDEFVQWPGLNVVEAIKVALEAKGYRVSEPIDMQHLGWELDISRGGKDLWLRVSVIEPELNFLFAENMTFFLWPDVKLFRAFLADLQAVLAADHRFSEIRWYPKGGLNADRPPAAGPFDD